MSTSDTTERRYRPYFERALARAVHEPEAVVIADRERQLTAAEFAALVYRLARALQSAGLQRRDRVAILATISPEALAIRYAAGLLACATSFCPNRGSDERLHAFLEHVAADVLIVFPETAGVAATAIAHGLTASTMSLGAVPDIDLDLLAVAGSMPSDPLAGRADPAGHVGARLIRRNHRRLQGEPPKLRRVPQPDGRHRPHARPAAAGLQSAGVRLAGTG